MQMHVLFILMDDVYTILLACLVRISTNIPSSAVTGAPMPDAAICRSTWYPLPRTASTAQGHAKRGNVQCEIVARI